MRVAVYGAGGVGGYFGARLAQAGVDVALLARGEHLQAIRNQGLRVESGAGDVTVFPTTATDTASEVGPIDVVLLGVKSWQVPAAAEAMRPLIGPETFVVPLQNGVDAAQQLSEVLGAQHVVGGLCALSSWIAAPGVIQHGGTNARIVFGELDRENSERTERLRELFAPAVGVTAVVAPDINAALWDKFVFIAPWSGVGAITRAPMGVIRAIPESYGLLVQAVDEAVAVAAASGVSLEENVTEETLARYAQLPAQLTASMQRDIASGRPSELHDQNGAIVRIGEDVRVPTPVHSFIYHSLIPVELEARDPTRWSALAGGAE